MIANINLLQHVSTRWDQQLAHCADEAVHANNDTSIGAHCVPPSCRSLHATVFAYAFPLIACTAIILCTGCGATKARTATEQLLMSDALDRAVAQIDFSALSHQKVHFDTRYIQNTKDPQFIGNVKGLGFVSADYVISSLRQQMVAAGLLLQDKPEEADYIVEARLGAVGTDNNEVIFGIPATNLLSSATMYMPNTPPIPAIPEISLAKRNVLIGAAKIGAFAYHRATRNPVWQAGISKATSTARDTWVLGAGPFQRGTIYEDFQVSGSQLAMPIGAIGLPDAPPETKVEGQVSYYDEFLFGPRPEMPGQGVQPAGLHEPINLQPVPMAPSSAAVPAPQVPTPQINGPAVTAATPVVPNTSEPAKNPAAAASPPSTNPSAK